jgi:hypothetical protein
MARRPAPRSSAHETRTPLLPLRRAARAPRGGLALDIDLPGGLPVGDDELDAIERLLGAEIEAILARRH